MRGWARWLLLVEILVCFLPCTLLLAVGIVMVPAQLFFLFREPLDWQGSAWLLFSVAGGSVGLFTLIIVVSRLLGSRERFEKPVLVLGCILAGIAPLFLTLVIAVVAGGEIEWGTLTLTAVLPLLASAHILLLSRSLFIASFREAQRPLVGPGTWITGAAVVAVIVVVLVMRQGVGYAALEERQAYWMQNKPAAYSYTSQITGWVKPVSLAYPKQVRVVGSTVASASYTFVRGPGDLTQYPPPTEGAWTIDDLFDALLKAKKSGAQVHVRFDGTTGAVLHARVESDKDGYWGFEVREFRVLDAAAAREPAPTFISR
jgi:hypothetical protein